MKSKIKLTFLALVSACLTAIPVKAAETIYFSYSPLMFSLRIESLEQFAKDGTINEDLGFYLKGATPAKKAEFREALTRRANINPVVLSRFFNTAMGADMLYRLGKGITIQGGGNGKYALRGALVSAAFDSEGLTLLNVLKKLPTNIQFQGEIILGLSKEIETAVLASETFTTKMREWTAQEAAATKIPVNYASLPNLTQTGPYQISKQVWHLNDKIRNREFYVDVYVPQGWQGGKMPVVVISHGLASRPEDFAYGAKHLASYGYLVALPQHPGSDTLWLKEMFEGYHKNIFDVNEFINRPKDVSYVIDELERRNASDFQGLLDLTNVGALGHSFGGYTVLALAGAEIDFDYLQKECDRPYGGLNAALILECRALELPRSPYSLRDHRIKAVFAANPVNRDIFGPQGIAKIAIPVMLGSGSYDPAANPIFEQAASFTWLTPKDKYLIMVEGQAHVNFTNLDAGITKTIDSVDELTLPSQELISDYANALALAFMQTYIGNKPDYRPFLQSAYAEYLSQGQQFKLDFITVNSSDDLANEIEKFKREHQNKSKVKSQKSKVK